VQKKDRASRLQEVPLEEFDARQAAADLGAAAAVISRRQSESDAARSERDAIAARGDAWTAKAAGSAGGPRGFDGQEVRSAGAG
jgi:hypothetical protein